MSTFIEVMAALNTFHAIRISYLDRQLYLVPWINAAAWTGFMLSNWFA